MYKKADVWDGIKNDSMNEINALIQPTGYKSPRATVTKATPAKSEKRQKGIVKWFNSVRGFGFVNGDDGSDYFFHVRECNELDVELLTVGTRVSFVQSVDKNGKTCAVKLR